MKKTLIFLILTFNFYCINISYAQKTISLSATSNGSYNLNKYSKIDVITDLPDSNNLGFIPSNILNDRKYIKPSSAVTNWLQSFVNKQFGSNANSKDALLWVIQDLSMGKDSTQKQEYSFVKIKADIYVADSSGYELINTFDSTLLNSNENIDFAQMIADAFVSLYKNSLPTNANSNLSFQQMGKTAQLTKENIINKTKLSNSYPILKQEYATGIYTSFAEFKNNTPAIKDFYAGVNPENNEVELYEIADDSSVKQVQKAWGICRNNELYFYSSGQLYPIEKSGNTFYMAKYLEPRNRKNQAFYWRKIIGARQGDTNPYDDAHVLKRSVPTAKNVSLEATHLDFDQEDFIY